MITAEAVFAPLEDEKDLEKWKGKLKGKIVLAYPTREVKASFDPLATRFNETDLKKLEEVDPTASPRRNYNRALFAFTPKRLQFLVDEGVAAVLEPSRSGDGGTIFVQQGGLYNAKAPQTYVRYPEKVPTQVVVAVEHYNRIARVLQKNVPVSIELNVKNAITESEDAFNVIAEIPGTDKADELVMLGAHFDSWHTGTGATDNARRIGGDAGGDAHPQGVGRQDAPHGPARAVDRRGAGTARLEGVREGELRRQGNDGVEAGAREDQRLLQRRQRHRRHSRRLPAGQRRRSARCSPTG